MSGVELRFITTNSPISIAIRAFTWSEWSHVDFLLPGEGYLGAHTDGGVEIRPFDYCKPTKSLTGIIECPDSVAEEVIKFAKSQIGKPYDLEAIFGIAIHRDWREPDHWFCSELVAWAFEQAKMPLLNADRVNRLSPRDVSMTPYLKVVSEFPEPFKQCA